MAAHWPADTLGVVFNIKRMYQYRLIVYVLEVLWPLARTYECKEVAFYLHRLSSTRADWSALCPQEDLALAA